MAIVIKNNEFEQARGLEYEGKEILKVLSVVIDDEGLKGFMAILDDASTALIPIGFFEEALGDKIYFGVV